jgi:hypothetical protein
MKLRLLQLVPPRAALAVLALVLLDSMGSGRARLDPDGGAPALRAGARPPADGAAQPGMPAGGDIDLTRLQRKPGPAAIVDLFAPPIAAPPPGGAIDDAPPAPTAPPLPFTYLGKTVDGDKLTVFVARGEDHYTLAPGQTIDKIYRVEKVTDAAVTFRYLPLGTRQVLSIRSPH